MLPALSFLCLLALGGAPSVESICVQAAPPQEKWTRTPNRTQAVLVLHGFHLHLTNKNVPKAELRPWQKNDSPLIKELGKHADVFVFAYGQNVPLDTVVKDSMLGPSVKELRKLGYSEITLMGHSAGGLIARQFVEDHPDTGITKVIQVCTPNGGSGLATVTAPKTQKVFLECLTIENRKKALEARADKKIPDKVQFVCVVARSDAKASGDGVVSCVNQWTADLHQQGVGAISVVGGHRDIMRSEGHAQTLSLLVRNPQERWPAERIEKTRKEIFGK